MKVIALISLALFATIGAAWSQDKSLPPGLSLPAKNLIGIKSFDAGSETYCVFSVRLPGEGDSLVTVPALVSAVKSLDVDALTKDPKGIVGKQFTTDAELATVDDEAVAQAHGDCTTG